MDSVFHIVLFWVLVIELAISLIMGVALAIDIKYNTNFFGKITGFVQKIFSKKKKTPTVESFRTYQASFNEFWHRSESSEQSEGPNMFNKLNVKFKINHE